MDSAYNLCLKDTGSNPAEACHYITTVGQLFAPTVLSEAEGQLNQLTPRIDGSSIATPGKSQLRSTQRFILNLWINRVPSMGGRCGLSRVAGNSV